MVEELPSTLPTALQDCITRQREVLDGLIRVVDALIAVSIAHESTASLREEQNPLPEPSSAVLALLLQAVGSSAHTISRLSDKSGLHTRDCYSVARSVVETASNVCYIIAEGPEMAARAMRHARQKSYRDLRRESTIGASTINLTAMEVPEAALIDGLADDLAEFTSRGNREKGWVDVSIDERIAATRKLGSRVTTALHWTRFGVYRHSSEILHGTFFSALYFFGLTAPSGGPRSPEELEAFLGEQHTLILTATCLALSAVIEGFHSAYGFQAAEERRAALIDMLREIPYFGELRRA